MADKLHTESLGVKQFCVNLTELSHTVAMSFAEFTAISTKSVALNIGDSHRIATCKFLFLMSASWCIDV